MNRKQILGAAALLAAITVLVYCPAMRAGFIWDDGDMVTNNALVKSARGLHDIWLGKNLTDYHPLTYSVFWLEWRCWGMNPAGYHAVSILLHAASVILLWLVLRKLRIPGSWLAALLFGVHPVCVASVAWIAELKNTLSLLFYLAALFCWLRSEEGEEGNRRFYALALVAFLLALLAKVSVVVLPVVLLLLAWWRHGRISRRDLGRAAPFFLLAVALGLFGMAFQNKYTAQNDPLLVRLLGGGWAAWFYLWKIFWPVHLTIIYPRWNIQAASPTAWIPGICFAAMLFVFWRKRAGWGRPLLFGTGYFVIALAPVLGLFKLVYLYFSQVADHLQYLAMPGIVALVTAGGWQWLGRTRTAGRVLVAAVAAVLSLLTWQNQSHYADMSSMWRDNLAANPGSFQALIFVGAEEESRGRFDQAGDMFRRALAIRPQSPEANLNLGIVLDDQGRTEEAIGQAEKALRLKPGDPDAHVLMARLLEKKGLVEEAAQNLREAVRVAPDHVAAHQNLGNLLVKQGRFDAAVQQFGEALKVKFDDPALFVALGNAQGRRGDLDAARKCFQKALSLDPDSADARNGLAALRQMQGATNAPRRP
ncbi:MAG: tetratricopeptide repeat protein [Verrucomicrobiota bacterium]|jgi:tetratricopeptide (TPR) repeat protein